MSSNSKSPTGRTDSGQHRQPRLVDNWISHLGFALVALTIMLLVTFALFSLVVGASTSYINIIGFLVLPSILVIGLLIVPLGMAVNYVWRVRGIRKGRVTSLPRIDLNDAGTRKVLLGFLAASLFLVLPTLAVSSYEGYRYTESTAFCANVCHTVMEPQATAHALSGHARVSCAACHIGEGASWFVKSKLSGTRQVFAVLFDTYPRPIPPAITELRPARETCEHCHWPAKFFGYQYREYPHYSPDEQNTKRTVKMFVKTGGADDALGRVEGIHAHMVLSTTVEYVATDNTLQDIPWVRYIDRSGRERIFRSDGNPASAPRPEGLLRTVDCMDCHNRGAHHFYPPQMALDRYLSVGRIDDTLPFIKQQAAAALTVSYPDVATAEASITRALTEFYQTQYPDVWKNRQSAVQQACESVVQIYRRDFFPTMKEDWSTYPENVGHLYSPGCLRCHDGLHLDDAGARISANCDVCHVFLVPAGGQDDAVVRGQYQHTMDLTQHKKLRCSQCHNGGRLLLCRDCHAERMRAGQWEEGQFRPDAP